MGETLSSELDKLWARPEVRTTGSHRPTPWRRTWLPPACPVCRQGQARCLPEPSRGRALATVTITLRGVWGSRLYFPRTARYGIIKCCEINCNIPCFNIKFTKKMYLCPLFFISGSSQTFMGFYFEACFQQGDYFTSLRLKASRNTQHEILCI